MPTVQAYGNRKVATEAIPGVRRQSAETNASAGVDLANAQARTDEAAAGLGATAAGVGIAITRDVRTAQDEERHRADQVAVFNAENQLAEWENKRLYDPQQGALGIKGQAALALPEQVGGEFQDLAGKVADGLTTPRQKEAFARVSLQRQRNLDLTLRRHTYQEMQTFEGNVLQATVENARNEAIQNATDPRRVGMALDRAVTAIKASGPRLGLPPEQVQEQVDAATSATHVGVIGQLLATDQTKTASIYFDETKSQIKGEALAHIEKALEEGRLRKDSQQKADAIIGAGGTLTQQREKARAIDDPKLRDEVTQRIEHEAAVSERAAREQEAATLRGVYDVLDQTHDVSRIPVPVWAGMDGSARSAARSYADHLAKGVAVETDFPTYYGLMQKAANEPEAFATENLLKYRATIGDTELKQLTTMQGAIVKGEHAKADAAGLSGFRTNDQILTDSLHEYGITAGGKDQTPADKAAIAELRRRLDRDLAAQEALTGKKPTNVDRQSALDKILSVSKTTPGSWWGLVPFTSTSVHDKTTRVIDIPLADRQQIEAALKAKGRQTDDATVLAVYVAAHK